MLRIIVERVFGAVLVLLVVSLVVFALSSKIPGDMATVLVGSEGATEAQYEALRESMGLNDPLLVQYISWLGNAITGDFGVSALTGRSVASEVARMAPISFDLAILGSVFSSLIGIPLGALIASRGSRRIESGIRTAMLVGFSIPIFVLGMLLIFFAARYVPGLYQPQYIPIDHGLVAHFRGMILPVASIAVWSSAMTMEISRASMLEQLRNSYVLGLRARAVPEWRVVYVHALRNAMPTILTFQAVQFGVLIGGMVVVEEMFNLPGIGSGLLDAVSRRDFALVAAIVMLTATVFVVVNTIVDLLTPILEPRRRAIVQH